MERRARCASDARAKAWEQLRDAQRAVDTLRRGLAVGRPSCRSHLFDLRTAHQHLYAAGRFARMYFPNVADRDLQQRIDFTHDQAAELGEMFAKRCLHGG